METMRKLRLSTKFLHQEIRWNYGILHSARTAMNATISVFVNCIETIIHLLFYNLHDCTFSTCLILPSRRKDVVETSFFWSQRCLRLVWNGSRENFLEMSSRRLPGDVLKTFSRRRPQDLFQETRLRCLRLHQDFSW